FAVDNGAFTAWKATGRNKIDWKDYYGTYDDYPDYVEKTRVLLATINDHNLSVNKLNGAAGGATGQSSRVAAQS
ncbi:hypothetical protein CYR55_22625, partial [Chimaeribacter californicus]